MGKYSSYAAKASPTGSDEVLILDVADTSMSAQGTEKTATLANVFGLGLQLDSTATDIQPTGNQSAGTSGLASRADHVHPLLPGQFQPSDSGWLSWSVDPAQMNGNFQIASGTIYLIRVNFRAAASVSNVVVFFGIAGATLTASQSFVGLYAGQAGGGFTAGQRIAVSADQSSAWANSANAATFMTINLAGGPFSIPVGFCWVALVCNGTTMPNFGRASNYNLVASNGGQPVSTARYCTNGTGTALPSTITPSSNVFLQQEVWAGVS